MYFIHIQTTAAAAISLLNNTVEVLSGTIISSQQNGTAAQYFGVNVSVYRLKNQTRQMATNAMTTMSTTMASMVILRLKVVLHVQHKAVKKLLTWLEFLILYSKIVTFPIRLTIQQCHNSTRLVIPSISQFMRHQRYFGSHDMQAYHWTHSNKTIQNVHVQHISPVKCDGDFTAVVAETSRFTAANFTIVLCNHGSSEREQSLMERQSISRVLTTKFAAIERKPAEKNSPYSKLTSVETRWSIMVNCWPVRLHWQGAFLNTWIWPHLSHHDDLRPFDLV